MPFHVTVLLHHWDLKNKDFRPQALRASGVTHVTFPIMWSRVEQIEGEFNFDYYVELIDLLTANGFKLILMLDAGGRYDFDDDGHILGANTVIPHFIRKDIENYAFDFYGSPASQLSFNNLDTLTYIERFYSNAVEFLGNKYRKDIFAFGVGIQSEMEIKYGQNEYKWRDYNKYTVNDYHLDTGLAAPVVDFGRSILGTSPPLKGYSSWLNFRERKLVSFVRSLTSVIRSFGHLSLGYFGEFFTSHDAIQALSVVTELGEYFDAAVVDYNFYDGWVNQADPWKVPMLANYARNLGYKYLFAGYYVERWRMPVGEPGSPVNPEIFPVIAQSLFECRWQNLIDGVEFGGFGDMARDLAILRSPIMNAAINHAPRRAPSKRIRIGILGSHATFNWFVGEHGNDTNIHSDALTQTFALFCSDDRFEPFMISDRTLKRNHEFIEALDSIYVPHQPVMSDETLDILCQYAAIGILIQDVRLGEWSADGEYRGTWLNDLFGIGAIGWRNGGDFIFEHQLLQMPPKPNEFQSHAVMAAVAPAVIRAPSTSEPNLGLVLTTPSTIALGYVPALIAGPNGGHWRSIMIDTLLQLLQNKHAANAA